MKALPLPPLALLRKELAYDPETGVFIRNGKTVGTLGRGGYVQFMVNYQLCLAHRVAFYIHHGREPEGQIDHVNGIKSDNRIANLREASASQNKNNTGIIRANRSGVKGVCWESDRNRWKASVGVAGRCITIGRFTKLADAKSAVIRARCALHGDFAKH